MSEGGGKLVLIATSMTRESTKACAEWWGKRAVESVHNGDAVYAGTCAESAAHFAHRLERMAEDHG